LGRTKEFNDYKIDGNITTIFVTQKDGTKFEILIDTEDLHKFLTYNKSWHVRYDKCTGKYYARSIVYHPKTDTSNYWYETILMHRFILDDYTDDIIDHFNHNQLDNRKENFRVTNTSNNSKYREDKNSNNKSGYRNVCEIDGKWVVQLQVNGKNTKLGSFTDVHEAGKFAEEKRKEIYKEYAGGS